MIDAEGVEWDLLAYRFPLLKRFDQISIDFHLLSLSRILTALKQ